MGLFGRIFKQKEQIAAKPLWLFNTASKEKDEFHPIREGLVRMYNCGPTVYDEQHIGNLRPYVFADTLKRTLLYNGYGVRQVINITDVGHLTGDNEGDADTGEDKMEKKAREEGKKARDIARRITTLFMKDLDKLNIRTKQIIFTKATDYIGEQIALIETLEQKGYTYKIDDGIYFDTSRFADYGKLGNIDLEKLKEGARVEANPQKRNPTDFALWKFSPEDEKREQEWDSPWGVGFPGWHLECTAMIFAQLGKQIDIHTGGIDHIPVHHNNEIAQAEAATGRFPHVRYWMHNAFITIEGQKISKSIGNTIYLRNLIDRKFNPLAYRYLLLTAHYRSPLNFTWESLEGAQSALTRLHRYFIEELGEKNGTVLSEYQSRFHEAVNDDVDTPKAVAILWDLVRDETVSPSDKRATLINFDKVLGIGLIEGSKRLKDMLRNADRRVAVTETPDEVQQLVEERIQARKEQNWELADELRQKIEAAGYRVADSKDGTTLRKL